MIQEAVKSKPHGIGRVGTNKKQRFVLLLLHIGNFAHASIFRGFPRIIIGMKVTRP